MPHDPPPSPSPSRSAPVVSVARHAGSDDQRAIRERVVRLAFGGDSSRFDTFLRALREAVPGDASVILRGSAVTGHRWGSDEPFDAAGPGTSDLDVTFVGGNAISLFREFHIPGLHSVPLGEAHPDAAPALVPLRQRLCALAGRPVNVQATTSLVQFVRDVAMRQPYLVLIAAPEPTAPEPTAPEPTAPERATRSDSDTDDYDTDDYDTDNSSTAASGTADPARGRPGATDR